MLAANLLQFLYIGLFYTCLRIVFKISIPDQAHLLEGTYLVTTFIVIVFSTSVKLELVSYAFWIASFIYSALIIIMLYCIISEYIDRSLDTIGWVTLSSAVAAILYPILLNLKRVKLLDIIKGTFYSMCLIPTHINIITIYAISNLHDVSWGSRPKVTNENAESRFRGIQSKREIEYKNFRSNVLVIWLLFNIAVVFAIYYTVQNSYYFMIDGLEWFLIGIAGFRIFFLTLFHICSCYKHKIINNYHGNYFPEVSKVI